MGMIVKTFATLTPQVIYVSVSVLVSTVLVTEPEVEHVHPPHQLGDQLQVGHRRPLQVAQLLP